MRLLGTLVILALLPMTAVAQALAGAEGLKPPVGWTGVVAQGGVVMMSPETDSSQRVVLTLLPATAPAAPVKDWFGAQALSLAQTFGKPQGATDVLDEGAILIRVVKVQNAAGLVIRSVFYGYASPHGYQISVLMIPPKVADDDPRLQLASDYVQSLAAGHFDVVLAPAAPPPGAASPQMPNLGPPPGGAMGPPPGAAIYQPRPVLPAGHDVPLTGVYFMTGLAYGAVNSGLQTVYGQHAVQQLLLLYANGVAVKSDILSGNLAGHHQAEGFATLDVTDPRVVSQGGFGRWQAQGGQVRIDWNYANPELLTRSGQNLEGPHEHWTPYQLMDGVKLRGAFVRRMEAGLRSQAIVLREDGQFIADGVNVVMGGEIVMPQFPSQGGGVYAIRKGSLVLTFANGFTIAIACSMDGNTLLLNNFPFVREQ